MGYYVPEELKLKQQWVCWRLETTSNGRISKVPYNPQNGKRASVIEQASWASYETALTSKMMEDYSGIGFVFAEYDRLVFIDIDNCLDETGDLSDIAAEVVEMFQGNYIETSQSEKGIHIVCKGFLKQAIKTNEIEVYSKWRYMAFTGNGQGEPSEAQEAIDKLILKYGAESIEKVRIEFEPGNIETDVVEQVIIRISRSRQKEKFIRLFNGDWSGYKSQSEADQAYIDICNAFADGNDGVVVELWKRSKLSERPKGRRWDYIKGMVMNAKRTNNREITTKWKKMESESQEKKKKRAFW